MCAIAGATVSISTPWEVAVCVSTYCGAAGTSHLVPSSSWTVAECWNTHCTILHSSPSQHTISYSVPNRW